MMTTSLCLYHGIIVAIIHCVSPLHHGFANSPLGGHRLSHLADWLGISQCVRRRKRERAAARRWGHFDDMFRNTNREREREREAITTHRYNSLACPQCTLYKHLHKLLNSVSVHCLMWTVNAVVASPVAVIQFGRIRIYVDVARANWGCCLRMLTGSRHLSAVTMWFDRINSSSTLFA